MNHVVAATGRALVLLAVAILAACGAVAGPSSAAPPANPGGSASASPAASPAAPDASVAPAKPGQLLVAYSEVVGGHLPLWAAGESGLFQRNGLDVDFRLIESSLSIGALLAGQVQLASVGGSEALAAAVEGGDLRVLAITAPKYTFRLEVTPDIKTPADLKGKKLAVSRAGSTSDTVTRIGLRKLGLDPDKDVSILQIGSLQARTAALRSGAIQGSMTLVPDTLALEDAGFHPLIDMAELDIAASSTGIVVQGAWLSTHRAETQKYVDSIVQSIARLRKDKPFALEVLKKYLKNEDVRLLEATYEVNIVRTIPALPYPKPEQFADTVAALSEKNPKTKTFDLTKLLDASFVQSAADRGLDRG